MSVKKIIRYKKPKNINIGTAVFAVIFLYLFIVLIQYAVKPRIKMYEVQDGDIANDFYYTGVILRQETVVNSGHAGYVNYYLREKQKASVGNLIFTVDENGSVNEYLNKTSGGKSRLSDENLKELKALLSSYSSSYSDSRFSDVYELSTSMSSMLLEYININTLQELSGSMDAVSLRKYYAKENGILLYGTDGMESLTAEQVTADIFSRENYKRTSYAGGQLIESGAPAYKLVTEDFWSVVVPLKEEEQEAYADVTSVSVHFPEKDLDAEAGFSIITGADGGKYGKLNFNKYMIQFAGERFVDLEVKNSQAEGLKLPKTALTSKEAYVIPMKFLTTGGDSSSEGFYKEVYRNDGSSTTEFVEADILRLTDELEKKAAEEAGEEIPDFCYVDPEGFSDGDNLILPDSNERFQIGEKETLPGVYNMNRGYAVFKYVKILDENSEYCVIKKNVSYSLRRYDHIVLNSERVSDADILR